jgi:hypothetical protein
MKPTFKAPRNKRLKLKCDGLLSIFSFKFNLRRYKWGQDILTTAVFSIILTAPLGMLIINILGPRWLHRDIDPEAGDLFRRIVRDANARPRALTCGSIHGGQGGSLVPPHTR